MSRFLVETTHDPEECSHVLGVFSAYGHITHFEWGCESGVCTGWAIIEAENEREALLSVLSLVRNKARAIKLNKFSPQKIQQFHT